LSDGSPWIEKDGTAGPVQGRDDQCRRHGHEPDHGAEEIAALKPAANAIAVTTTTMTAAVPKSVRE
jgi:hypothetical protein